MNKNNQSNETIMLKQKIIHLQSEVSKYKQKLNNTKVHHDQSFIDNLQAEKAKVEAENERLKEELSKVKNLLWELETENKRHKGSPIKDPINNPINNSAKGIKVDAKTTHLDGWFINNLVNQSKEDSEDKK